MERITSRRNPLCAHLKKLGASRSYREACGEFLCDGLKLLEEAVNNGAIVTDVLTSSHVPFPMPIEARMHYADRGIIDSLSPLKNAQDTLFACKIPKTGGRGCGCECDCLIGTHVLLDGLQDPGNVGTIIRTASAFGIASVMLAGGCADPYNPKAVRSTMGAIFRQSICFPEIAELRELKDRGARFVGAALGEESADISVTDLRGSIIAIGSEGRGLSEEVAALCAEKARIPMAPGCESLNAATAAAIFIYLAAELYN